MHGEISPSLSEVRKHVREGGNVIPIFVEEMGDLLTPVSAYLKLKEGQKHSFLLESVEADLKIARYSFLGTNPYKIISTGPREAIKGDPLVPIEEEMRGIKYVPIKGLPSFTGGAIGFIAYDCIKYFEPRVACDLVDNTGMPESMHMFCDTIVVFDHVYRTLKIVSHVRFDKGVQPEDIDDQQIVDAYREACRNIRQVADTLEKPGLTLPPYHDIAATTNGTNDGRPLGDTDEAAETFKAHVRKAKEYIINGDIIQCVPARRVEKKTPVHPFNLYRELRTVNPSPYMFYIDGHDYQIIGASPEALVKVIDGVVETHPIAGTAKRGKTPQEDQANADALLGDPKERAEHIMLVDLGRNDVNRICEPSSNYVERLMTIQKFSHVMHIVSVVKGKLRKGMTSFDAFRSIMPAGTVSGAPKIRAIEIVSELEGQTRGVYAGAAGYFAYNGDLDTCIALRTMWYRNGIIFLQAGGGIVYDSTPENEYQETINKLNSNIATVRRAEERFAFHRQAEGMGNQLSHEEKVKSESTQNANKRQKI
eukprot:Clim_evm41s22 gene=Clim_evmTU41s22